MADANKTQLTRQVTFAATLWLSERGFKPVETEVHCERGWLADIAGFCFPTRTEVQKLKLLPRKPQWSLDKPEPQQQWEDDYQALAAPLVAVVEVKTSLQDFQQDGKFERPSPVHLLWVALPLGLVGDAQVNERWGILRYDKSGNVKQTRIPHIQFPTVEQILAVVCKIAVRRDHFTRYERLRELDRQSREENNDRINRERISRAVRMVLKIVSGETTAEQAVKDWFGPSAKLSSWEMARLRELEKQK